MKKDAQRGSTLPRLLRGQAAARGLLPAIREKSFGIWDTTSWQGLWQLVGDLSCGLAELGFSGDDRLIIIGNNRPRLYASFAAVQSLGGVPVPAYQDSIATELQYVIAHSEARFVIVEDQEQLDKILEVRADCPNIEFIIYDEARGISGYEAEGLLSLDDLLAKGRRWRQEKPDFFEAAVERGGEEDVSVILYTSGTTGRPKGVVLTHRNIIAGALMGHEFDRLRAEDEIVAYLPMAWVGDHIFSYAQAIMVGFTINCPEKPSTLATDMREIGPTYFFAPPRSFENMLRHSMIRMADASAPKRALFNYFIKVARRLQPWQEKGEKGPWGLRLQAFIGEWLVYGPLRDSLGLGRIRLAYTAGEAIGAETFRFFRSIGVNLKQLYGQTEASVFVTIQPDHEAWSDTVGVAVPGVEIKIHEGGEVLYRSSGVFKEYFKDPEGTAKARSKNLWTRTGDVGVITEKGHLKIIDRLKDVGKFADGSLFAPKYIENKLKFFQYIKEAVVFGAGREYCTAMINIDFDAASSWAERQKIVWGSYQELAANPRIYDLIGDCVGQINAELAREQSLASSQIRRFAILHKELDADDGELTRTSKVRRTLINERYEPLIANLYSGKDDCHLDVEITYEDGRRGHLSGLLAIRDSQSSRTDLGAGP